MSGIVTIRNGLDEFHFAISIKYDLGSVAPQTGAQNLFDCLKI
jgi:hypothetical protein